MNSRYHTTQHWTINFDDAIMASPVYMIERTPKEEIEHLKSQIAKEQGKLDAFASNPRVCAVSQANIELHETEIAKWQAAIMAAEHEQFERVQRMARIQKNLLPETTEDLGRIIRAVKAQKARNEQKGEQS